MKNQMKLGASVSCFDLYDLKEQFQQIHEAPIDFMHFDVVDGSFNQCIILGLPTLEAIRPHTALPIEVHLAVYEPKKYIEQYIRAGANYISIHPEGSKDILGDFELIRKLGAKCVLALRSETQMNEELLQACSEAEYIIKLTVNPGFSGQKIQEESFQKMKDMRAMLDDHNIETPICADGNVNIATIPKLMKCGSEMLIGGTSGLFLKNQSVKASAEAMINAMNL